LEYHGITLTFTNKVVEKTQPKWPSHQNVLENTRSSDGFAFTLSNTHITLRLHKNRNLEAVKHEFKI